MDSTDISANVKELLAPIASDRAAVVEAVVFKPKMTPPVLEITVARSDSAESLDIEQVADLARSFSKKLDEVDPIEVEYTLEVTTPGITEEQAKADQELADQELTEG